jgi:hypothetical protein
MPLNPILQSVADFLSFSSPSKYLTSPSPHVILNHIHLTISSLPPSVSYDYLLTYLLIGFSRQVFSVYPWMSWNSLCRPGCPLTQKSSCLCLLSAGIKGMLLDTRHGTLLKRRKNYTKEDREVCYKTVSSKHDKEATF